MAVPGKLQYAVKAMLPKAVQNELIFRWYAGPRNWAGCRAIALPNNDSVGAIRLLVEGRDRHGVIPPADYRKTCDEIADALYEPARCRHRAQGHAAGFRSARRIRRSLHGGASGPHRSVGSELRMG